MSNKIQLVIELEELSKTLKSVADKLTALSFFTSSLQEDVEKSANTLSQFIEEQDDES